jgi:Ca-activated chloride channel homolog
MSFGAPWLLPLLLVAPGVATLFVWAERRRRAARARYAGSSALPLAAGDPRRRRLKEGLLVGALLLLALAAARPRFGTRSTTLQRSGADVIIALDVSLSMSAPDAPPTRLDRAKIAIGALLTRLQGDRVGLVTFAGSATLRFPLSTDLVAAGEVVQDVSLKDGGLDAGTSIGDALKQAAQGFSGDKTHSKVLLLVSDGEDLGGNADQAAAFARNAGVLLDTMGVGGTQPVPLNFTDPRTGKQSQRTDPASGQPLTTTANPDALRALAAANGGSFFDGNADSFAPQLADEIDRLQKTRFADQQGDQPIEQYQWFLGAGLLLLTAEFLIPAGRGARRGSAGWTLVRRLRIRQDRDEAGGGRDAA